MVEGQQARGDGVTIVHGEAIRFHVLTGAGWQDITDLAEVELSGGDFEPSLEVTFEVVIEDFREYVETASGKYIAAIPRTEV